MCPGPAPPRRCRSTCGQHFMKGPPRRGASRGLERRPGCALVPACHSHHGQQAEDAAGVDEVRARHASDVKQLQRPGCQPAAAHGRGRPRSSAELSQLGQVQLVSPVQVPGPAGPVSRDRHQRRSEPSPCAGPVPQLWHCLRAALPRNCKPLAQQGSRAASAGYQTTADLCLEAQTRRLARAGAGLWHSIRASCPRPADVGATVTCFQAAGMQPAAEASGHVSLGRPMSASREILG